MAASMIGMVGFGWATDRLGPQAALLGMAAILGTSAAWLLLIGQFGDLRPADVGNGRKSL